MIEVKKNAIVICGPTATGKTHLAVSVAHAFNGEIISADSRQVYRGMDLGTGKDLEEYDSPQGIVSYHCIDIADPKDTYTLYHYQQDCSRVIREIWSRKKVPIIVGGTGLYIEAVLKKYDVPNVPEDQELRKSLMALDRPTLIKQLNEIDPIRLKRTDVSSKKRIVRSIEVARYIEDHPAVSGASNTPDLQAATLGVTVERGELFRRIDARLQIRLDQGMIEEVVALLDRGVTPERLELFGMEYKHIVYYLTKKVSKSEMFKNLSQDIHRLAKRQMTYFRGFSRRGLPIHWSNSANKEEALSYLNQYSYIPESLPNSSLTQIIQ